MITFTNGWNIVSLCYREKTEEKKKIVKINNQTLIDSGSGFFIEENTKLTQDDLDAAVSILLVDWYFEKKESKWKIIF